MTVRQITLRLTVIHLTVFFLLALAVGELQAWATAAILQIPIGVAFVWITHTRQTWTF